MTPESILSLATNDSSLAPQEKSQLVEWLHKPDVAKHLSGAAGAALGVVLAKYAKLGRTAQVLLGIAGYGAGRIVYNFLKHKQEHRQFAPYNDKLKQYEMDSTRY